MDMGAILAADKSSMKKVNWSATKPSTTTVQWKDQTTLVGRPFKTVTPIFFFLVVASCRCDSSARGTGPIAHLTCTYCILHEKRSQGQLIVSNSDVVKGRKALALWGFFRSDLSGPERALPSEALWCDL